MKSLVATMAVVLLVAGCSNDPAPPAPSPSTVRSPEQSVSSAAPSGEVRELAEQFVDTQVGRARVYASSRKESAPKFTFTPDPATKRLAVIANCTAAEGRVTIAIEQKDESIGTLDVPCALDSQLASTYEPQLYSPGESPVTVTVSEPTDVSLRVIGLPG